MKQEPLTGKTNMPRISCLRKVTIMCGCGVRYNWYTVVTILEDDENGKRSKTWGVGGGGGGGRGGGGRVAASFLRRNADKCCYLGQYPRAKRDKKADFSLKCL